MLVSSPGHSQPLKWVVISLGGRKSAAHIQSVLLRRASGPAVWGSWLFGWTWKLTSHAAVVKTLFQFLIFNNHVTIAYDL